MPEQVVERHRRQQREGVDRKREERRAFERENPGKLYRPHGDSIGPEVFGDGAKFDHVADVMDPTSVSPGAEEAEAMIQAIRQDREFMSNYKNGDPIAIETLRRLEAIAYGGAGR